MTIRNDLRNNNSSMLIAAGMILSAGVSACYGAGEKTGSAASDSSPPGDLRAYATSPLPANAIAPFFPYMAWHQGNKDGFHQEQWDLLTTQPYQFVIIPKMHRENLEPSYYVSLAYEVGQLAPYQSNIMGYFNAHYYCPRYAIAGYTPSNWSSAGGSGECTRTFSANTAAAHKYVDAALNAIAATGVQGIYIDFPWSGATDLGILAGYIIKKASSIWPNNIVVNTKSKGLANKISAASVYSWYAHIEEVGPEPNFFPCSGSGSRPEMCTPDTVNTLMTNLWNDPLIYGIVGTSMLCDETDSSTWTAINGYRAPGRFCEDPTGCYFECNNGFSCSNPGNVLTCGAQ